MPHRYDLSDVLSEFARNMITDFPIQGILDHLVKRIVEVLPITAAGVTLISPGADPRYVAASDASALRFEELQSELGEGPCLAAYENGEAVAIADLAEDDRFPAFAPRALEAGLVAVFTFPMRGTTARLGALDLYRDTAGPLGAATMTAAQTLADVAAAYILNAEARAKLEDSHDLSRKQALHDALTGLPNRALLLERLEHANLRAQRSRRAAAVLFIDLDRFKRVNDAHGHKVGDELLVCVADRLSKLLRPADTLARLSGDEFVVLCEDLDDPAEADAIADRAVAALAARFTVAGTTVDITASVGVAFAGPGDQLTEELLRDADTAMYQAKRSGGARHQVIDLRERRIDAERDRLRGELEGAGDRGELLALYQPIVETVGGLVTGVEALLRWAHPTRGLVHPREIIPLAERDGSIDELGRWMLQRACKDRIEHQLEGLTMAVNVSAQQLISPDFGPIVASVLAETATDPAMVTVELTESVFIQDSARASVVLNELKALGLRLALDDFGTGYSSLNYLKRFPIDTLKIDREFVVDVEHNVASRAIVHAVIELAHVLGMTVVAEGVETAAQLHRLVALGADLCQGYLFAAPMTAEALAVLLPRDRAEPLRLAPTVAGRSPIRSAATS